MSAPREASSRACSRPLEEVRGSVFLTEEFDLSRFVTMLEKNK
jgi:hypothetical protein